MIYGNSFKQGAKQQRFYHTALVSSQARRSRADRLFSGLTSAVAQEEDDDLAGPAIETTEGLPADDDRQLDIRDLLLDETD